MALMEQLSLLADAAPDLPDGMRYAPGLVTEDEERALAERIAALPFAPFAFRGFEGLRRVVSFGWRYDFEAGRAEAADLIPAWLLPLRERAARFAGLDAEALAQVLVTEYAPGAPIGWHRDRPVFGEVVGVSLLAPCSFRLRRETPSGWARRTLTLEPRSAYHLTGEARTAWEHSIPPVTRLRYSITFRTLSRGGRLSPGRG